MDGQILALIITSAVSLITLIWKTSHDARAALAASQLQHDQARQDRIDAAAQAKAEREDEARLVREKLELSARQLEAQTQRALNEQTSALSQKIEDARTHMIERADLAFTEANDVNTKIAKLHQMQLQQGAVLERLLGQGQGS